MIVMTIDIDLAKSTLNRYANRLPRVMQHAIKVASELHLVQPMKRNLEDNDQVVTGKLYRDVGTETKLIGTVVEARVGALTSKYGYYVEEGVPPGTMQSLTKLEEWYKIKFRETDPDKVKMAARFIQRKIFREGTAQHRTKDAKWIEPAVRQNKNLFANEVKNLIYRLAD